MTLIEAKHICTVEYVSSFFASLWEAYSEIASTLGETMAYEGYKRIVARLLDNYATARAEGLITAPLLAELIQTISRWDNRIMESVRDKSNPKPLLSEQSNVKSDEDCDYCEKYRQYRLGCISIPKDIDKIPFLAPRTSFVAPRTVDLRDYCTPTRDQGKNPWCAAYAATDFASNVNWRKDDKPSDYDVYNIYTYAKTIDGSPTTDGTSLDAVLKGLLNYSIFDREKCEVRMLRTSEQVKYAVHKFGCCIVGMMVSAEWYSCNKNKSTISGKKDSTLIGGHAVLVCGYNKDGVFIHNSWGTDWGSYGFALITWKEFEREFIYGAVLDNCLYDMKMH